MQNELTLSEFRPIFEYLLENNKTLVDSNRTPLSIGLEGAAGIGKTQFVKQVAEAKGMTIATICLSELQEIGDLVGYPLKEVWVTAKDKNGNVIGKWWPEGTLGSLPMSVTRTNRTRMSYAPPAWLPSEANPNGTILYLDDFSRANNMFMQAIMTIICEGTYVSWSLPKYTTVVLSSNPDDGEYTVSSLDPAMLSRYMNFNIKFDQNTWAEWAEGIVDSRAINFALLYGSEIFEKKNNVQIANARNYTNFCKAISGIKNWSKPESLAMILQISKGAFLKDRDNIIGNLFTSFIANKLDKLIQPKEMLELKWETLEPKMQDCVYDETGRFHPEIASVLTIRFMNYILYLYSIKNGVKESVVNDRILEIVGSDTALFSEDLIFHLVKTLISRYPGRTSKLLMDPIIRNKVVL